MHVQLEMHRGPIGDHRGAGGRRARSVFAMYTSAEVCRLAGCTYRQLDYWIRAGYVTPRVPACGSGSSRLFDDGDLERVGELKRAADALRRGLAAV